MAKRRRTEEQIPASATHLKHEVPEQDPPTPAHSPPNMNRSFTAGIGILDNISAKTLDSLYTNNVEVKLWEIASKAITQRQPPTKFPEYTQPGSTEYVKTALDFWTSGFFPGSLYCLLQRKRRYEAGSSTGQDAKVHELQLEFACKWWTENLHQNAYLTTTHDLGFMIAPWAKPAWELNRDYKALGTMIQAAKALHGRFHKRVGLIRSWDTCVTKRYQFLNPAGEFLTIIDNMMNLDLLFYVSRLTNNKEMFDDAVQHARTTMRTHIRSDHWTIHLVSFDPKTGDVRESLTNQGYTDTSCWTRGQAWAIAGFAESYHWTQAQEFLTAARQCADYFLRRLPSTGVPPWDFDAADEHGVDTQPTDTSAAIVTAYGLILIHKALAAMGQESTYLASALKMVESTCRHHLNDNRSYQSNKSGIAVGETILNGATINNHKYAPRRWANHGLVYADYYFMSVGNLLLDMGVGQLIRKAAT
ncbi:unsaturated glucuronyl hydrolase [Xylariaceae sp. FL1272]|nr:unsaturated glucuronyl hydrolase [Xylariaceae sp. FL1272]